MVALSRSGIVIVAGLALVCTGCPQPQHAEGQTHQEAREHRPGLQVGDREERTRGDDGRGPAQARGEARQQPLAVDELLTGGRQHAFVATWRAALRLAIPPNALQQSLCLLVDHISGARNLLLNLDPRLKHRPELFPFSLYHETP